MPTSTSIQKQDPRQWRGVQEGIASHTGTFHEQ